MKNMIRCAAYYGLVGPAIGAVFVWLVIFLGTNPPADIPGYSPLRLFLVRTLGLLVLSLVLAYLLWFIPAVLTGIAAARLPDSRYILLWMGLIGSGLSSLVIPMMELDFFGKYDLLLSGAAGAIVSIVLTYYLRRQQKRGQVKPMEIDARTP